MRLATNAQRARWADIALRRFRAETGSDADTAVSDLIANLGHHCDRHGIDYVATVESGLRHWLAEREPPQRNVVIIIDGGVS